MVCEKNIECEDYLMKFYWLEAIMIACTCINPFLYKFGIFKAWYSKSSQSYSL
jgi:hypothetical protein